MRLFIGGVNASGKSTILKKVANLSGYQTLHGAGLLMEHLNCSGDYEVLRSFSDEEKSIAYTQVIEKLCKEQDNFLLDSHYLTLIRGRVTNMTTDRLKDFDSLVLISAPLETVWNRIQSSPRDRALFPDSIPYEEAKKLLANYQLQTQEEFNRAVKEYNLPGIHIENDTADPGKATEELHSFIRSLER